MIIQDTEVLNIQDLPLTCIHQNDLPFPFEFTISYDGKSILLTIVSLIIYLTKVNRIMTHGLLFSRNFKKVEIWWTLMGKHLISAADGRGPLSLWTCFVMNTHFFRYDKGEKQWRINMLREIATKKQTHAVSSWMPAIQGIKTNSVGPCYIPMTAVPHHARPFILCM